ncbi:MAG: hypothetical protein PHH73_03925 [Candidatus Rickettsiella isopodorum]|nr:hypothetical protein [Candidatus Rickettsiella isopodorum]
MKNWTRKFLTGDTYEPDRDGKGKYHNAEKAAESELKIPEKLWLDISDEIPFSNLFSCIKKFEDTTHIKYNTLFMAGFACGWAEKSRKIK